MKQLMIIMLVSVMTLAGILVVAEDKPAVPIAKTANSSPDLSDSAAAPVAATDKVIAYYFYTTQRCPSCKKIEAYSREAIDSGFAAELKSNLLEFRPLNIDEDTNKHFIEDYQLYTKSLVVTHIKDSKQIEWKNLTKVWELLNDKKAFQEYVRDEINAYLAKK